jgi:hypothetical protein
VRAPPTAKSTLVKWIPAIAAVALIAAACGGSDAGEVRPFEEIQASDVVFENDPTFPGRAIFRVTTTEPAICAIVWGETEELGNFNNSLDMNGTGIIQHDVFLPGAEAGQTYFYRLQGSTADGSLFQSELMTFTLPEAAPGTSTATGTAGDNLALGAKVSEVSSEFSASWSGANAIDDDLGTEWSTAGDGDAGYIVIDLGSPQQVAGFEFLTRTMADGSATTTTYTVTVDDGETIGPFDAGNPADTRFAAATATGQVFRFDINASTGGNTGAIEIRILAP